MPEDPFLRPRLRVRKRNLPFKVLEVFRTRALRDVQRILLESVRVVEKETADAPPSPLDEAFIGVNRLEKPEQALKAADRRRQYGAPVVIDGQWTRLQAVRLAKAVEVRWLFEIEVGEVGSLGEVKEVPTQSIWMAGKVDSGVLVDMLMGKGGVILKVRKALRGYVAVEGLEVLIAARLTHLPTVLVAVVGEIKKEEAEKVINLACQGELIMAPLLGYTRRKAYTLLSALEPLAELARLYSLEDFLAMCKGEAIGEEKEWVGREMRAEQMKVLGWKAVYDRGREEGLAKDDARSRADEDGEFLRRGLVLSGVQAELKRVKNIAREKRLGMIQRMKEIRDLTGEEGWSPNLNYSVIWVEANKAKHRKKRYE